VLANRSEVTLVGVLGHCGIPGNEEADEIIKQGATMTLLNPQPALGIS
jgi:ribonuclease HI